MAFYIMKCTNKTCKAVKRITPEKRGEGRFTQYYFEGKHLQCSHTGWLNMTCACGKAMIGKAVQGLKTKQVCNTKCTSATGFQCECSCEGKNHGASHWVTQITRKCLVIYEMARLYFKYRT